MGFYEAQRDAILALAEYVSTGNASQKQAFEEQQTRVGAIIRQISLSAAKP